jgi:hypothetical protein
LVAFFRPQGSSLFEKMRILIWLINIEKKKREKLGEYEKGHILGDEPSTFFSSFSAGEETTRENLFVDRYNTNPCVSINSFWGRRRKEHELFFFYRYKRQ